MKRAFSFFILCLEALALSFLLGQEAHGIPLDTIGSFCATFPSQCAKGGQSLWAARGTGTNTYYVLEVDPTTGALPVNVTGGSFTITIPANGPTGSSVPADADYQGLNNGGTLIGAIGDSSGRTIVAGAGVAGTPAGGVVSVQGVSSGTALPISAASLPLPTGAATSAKQPALGTAGSASTDVLTVQGIAGGTTLPVSGTVTASQGGAPWTVTGTGTAGSAASGVLTVQGIASMTALKVDGSGVTGPVNVTQFGGSNVATGTGTGGSGIPRVTVSSDSSLSATNFPTTVDTNSGAAGSSTLRAVISTRSEAAATPLSVRLGNGSSFADYGSGVTSGATMRVVASTDSAPGAGRAYADSIRYAYSSGAVGLSTWVQVISSTFNLMNCIQIFDSSGQTLEMGIGAAASETRVLIIPPGGLDGCVPLKIPQATRVSLRALSASTGTVGEFDLTGLQ